MSEINQSEGLPLVLTKDGPRVDSRIIAEQLGIENRALIQNIDNHMQHFEAFGVVTFQMRKPPKGSKGGMPVRFALLNEDQAYFSVTLSRNTQRAVDLKFRLVVAFSEVRKAQEARTGQYLPFQHLAHDATRLMAQQAANAGSATPEAIHHSNIERMINKAFDIEAGQRHALSEAQRNAISAAYQITANAIREVLDNGGGHQLAYEEAKRRVHDFVRLFGPANGRLSA